jgi:hypothetical protein
MKYDGSAEEAIRQIEKKGKKKEKRRKLAAKFKIIILCCQNGRHFLDWMLSFYFPNLEVSTSSCCLAL